MDVNDVLDGLDDPDVNVDLVQLTVWIQGNDWGQGNNVDGFGGSLQELLPQLLLGQGICFGLSSVLPSELLTLFLPDSVLFLPDSILFLPDSILALSGLEKLFITLLPGPLVVVLGLSHGCR